MIKHERGKRGVGSLRKLVSCTLFVPFSSYGKGPWGGHVHKRLAFGDMLCSLRSPKKNASWPWPGENIPEGSWGSRESRVVSWFNKAKVMPSLKHPARNCCDVPIYHPANGCELLGHSRPVGSLFLHDSFDIPTAMTSQEDMNKARWCCASVGAWIFGYSIASIILLDSLQVFKPQQSNTTGL